MKKSRFLYKVKDGLPAKLGHIWLAFTEPPATDRLVLRSYDVVECPYQVTTAV